MSVELLRLARSIVTTIDKPRGRVNDRREAQEVRERAVREIRRELWEIVGDLREYAGWENAQSPAVAPTTAHEAIGAPGWLPGPQEGSQPQGRVLTASERGRLRQAAVWARAIQDPSVTTAELSSGVEVAEMIESIVRRVESHLPSEQGGWDWSDVDPRG